jgi:hypothetical protein
MDSSTQVLALSAHETDALLADKGFSMCHPSACNACGAKGPFSRTIFRLIGADSRSVGDDTFQDSIRLQLNRTRGIVSAVFKTVRRKHYVDTALCANCASTNVVYDIDYTDELFRSIADKTGRHPAQVRADLEQTALILRAAADARHATPEDVNAACPPATRTPSSTGDRGELAADRASRVLGYVAFGPGATNILCDGDSCIVAGSERLLRAYITAFAPQDGVTMDLRKARYGQVLQAMRLGGAYSFDSESYARFAPLARVDGIQLSAFSPRPNARPTAPAVSLMRVSWSPKCPSAT